MLQRFDIANLPASPWKNGGGSTREVACRPDGADMNAFNWLVSIATIAQSGSFSILSGVDRVIMLLVGNGVHLRSSSGIDHTLDQTYTPFAFPGDIALDCTLLGNTSTDFNVMSRRGALHADVQVLRGHTNIAATSSGLLLVLRGDWQLTQHGDVDAVVCVADQSLWWDAETHGWNLVQQVLESAIAWVYLNAGTGRNL